MKPDRLPPQNKKKDKEVIDALVVDSAYGTHSALESSGGNYTPSPKIIDPSQIAPDLMKETLTMIEPGSISSLIYKALKIHYPKFNFSLDSKSKKGEESFVPSMVYVHPASKKEAADLYRITTHTAIRVLEMEIPKENFLEGEKLERDGFWPKGTTQKCYARHLENEEKMDGLQREKAAYPITNEEAMEIIVKVLKEVLG